MWGNLIFFWVGWKFREGFFAGFGDDGGEWQNGAWLW